MGQCGVLIRVNDTRRLIVVIIELLVHLGIHVSIKILFLFYMSWVKEQHKAVPSTSLENVVGIITKLLFYYREPCSLLFVKHICTWFHLY